MKRNGTTSIPGRISRVLAGLALATLLAACNPVQVAGTSDLPFDKQNVQSVTSPLPANVQRQLQNEPVMSLRGDENFSTDALSDGQLLWYDRLWEAIRHPKQHLDAAELAASDNEYQYARSLFEYDSALLLALRATGDLRFLDEVDEIAQEMRAHLRDGWCSGLSRKVELGRYRTMRGRDGFLNFRRRLDSDPVHHCRDTSDLEETLMHGHLALIMYAYHVNRDLQSPAGVDYAERADFWLGYLLNHFEAKWRERSGVRFPDMNFIDTKFCHTYNVFTLYHYFIGKRLQDDGIPAANAYLLRALEMTDAMLDTPYRPGREPGGFEAVSTPLGEAVVWSFGSPGSESSSDARLEACPVMYSRYLTAAAVQLRLENFYRWDKALLTRIATGMAHFVMDTDQIEETREGFAAGVTGSSKVAGMPATDYRDRLGTAQYGLTLFPTLAAWDESGRVAEISRRVYESLESEEAKPRRVMTPASFLLVETISRSD